MGKETPSEVVEYGYTHTKHDSDFGFDENILTNGKGHRRVFLKVDAWCCVHKKVSHGEIC